MVVTYVEENEDLDPGAILYVRMFEVARSLLSPTPKLHIFARTGPPFVIRSVLNRLGCRILQMVDLSERENGVWGWFGATYDRMNAYHPE